MADIRFGAAQIIFKQISAIMGCTVIFWIDLSLSCCDWSEFLLLGDAGSKSVFREVGIGLTSGENEEMELLFRVRSVWYIKIRGYLVEKLWCCWKFSAILGSKFWKLIHRESWLEIFWENALLMTGKSCAKEIFLFPRIKCRFCPTLPFWNSEVLSCHIL